MFDYKNFRPEEFATDQSFRNWKLKGRQEDARFWTEWVAQNPDKQTDIEKASLLLEAVVESFDQISEAEIQHEIHRLAGQLAEAPPLSETQAGTQPERWWSLPYYQVAAAALLCLLSLGWWLLRDYRSVPAPLTYSQLVEHTEVPLTEFVNTTASPRLITLSDGSAVTVQPGSKLSYEPDFTGSRREVYLSGEAFFEVSRNPEKPFFVYAEQLVTKVLGTSFTVRANPGEDEIEVLVRSGRVSVYSNSPASGQTQKDQPTNEVVVKPNQKVVFLARENQFARSLVETPELLEAPEIKPNFVFKATPIREVFERLEKAYGIEIIFDEELMQNCFLTGSFTDEPLFEKLDLITRTLNASYQQVDGQIVITSKGC